MRPHRAIQQADYDFDAGVDPALDAALEAVRAQPETVRAPEDLGAAITGLWFDPERDGEGWHVQAIDDERVFVTLYSFTPDGDGAPQWIVGLATWGPTGELLLDELVTAKGGRFGANLDDPAIDLEFWGTGVIKFTNRNSGIAELSGPDSYRGFTFYLRRLSKVPGIGCDVSGRVTAPALAGSWFVPGRSGEGWLLTPISDQDYVVSWYTFDETGMPVWFVGTGSVSDAGLLRVPELVQARGAAWGHDFDGEAVVRRSVGALVFEPGACAVGTVTFEPVGDTATLQFAVQRLTAVQGLDSTPDCP